MAQETILIDFQVDYSQLTSAQEQLAKTGKIDNKGFQAIQSAINTTADDTKGLIKTFKDVAGASIKMGKTVEDAFGAGIQDALDEAGVSLGEFESHLKKANAPTITLKKELLALKEAMARMKVEGKDTGKEFDALRTRAGKLADAVADANKEIKNAGSDTRGIDNVVGSISALAGGYAAVQGAAALFGEENEDVQKALLKVNGAMALAQGLQVIYNASLKEGALAKLADSVITGTQTAAMTLLTFVTTGATVAARVYRAALLATGIGAIVVLVLALVSALDTSAESMEAVNKTIEDNNRLLEESNKLIVRQSVLQEERAKAAGAAESELLRIRGKALVAQRDNIVLENQSLAAQRDRLKSTSLEYGALNKRIEENLEIQKDLNQQINIINIQGGAQLKKELNDRIKAQEELNKKKLDEMEKSRLKELASIKEIVLANLKKDSDAEEQVRIHYDNLSDITEEGRAKIEAVNKKWDDLRLEQMKMLEKASQTAADKIKADRDKEMADLQERAAQIISIGTQIGAVFAQISDAQSARDNALIASRRRDVEDQFKAGVITQKAFEARQKQIDQAERIAKQKAAERDKKLAVFQALIAVPQAFLTGLKTSLPLAIIMGALAAVQAALVISRPIPKFFKGKKGNYEGPGEVADMGAELVERNGRMFLYTKPTQTYLGAKDKVYTAGETRQILHNTNISTQVRPQPAAQFDYKEFGKAIPKDSININIDKDFISESVRNGLSKTNYMDRRYSSR